MEAEKNHSLLSKSWKPRKPGYTFSVWVWRPKTQGSWWYYMLVWVWRPKNWKCWCPRAEDECLILGKEWEVPLPLLFCSIKVLNRLDDAHLHWGAQSSLLSLPTHMLISSRNNVLPAIWAPLSPVNLTHKVNCHAIDAICALCVCRVCSVAPPCPTLCNCMGCSPPSSSVHGISQARILEWVAISCSRGISLTQGLKLCLLYLLHWQADLGSPIYHSQSRTEMLCFGFKEFTLRFITLSVWTLQTILDRVWLGMGGIAWEKYTDWNHLDFNWLCICVQPCLLGSSSMIACLFWP